MGWNPGPDRYVGPGRKWIPKWRFSPFTNLDDAFKLLEKVASRFTLTGSETGVTAEVQIRESIGCASASSTPYAVTMAVARALGLSNEGPE
jgi:hypothetical protein